MAFYFRKFRLRNTLEILKTLDASYFITTPSGRLVYAKSLGELDCNKPVAGFINTALFGGESPEKEIFRRGLMELTHGSETVEKTISGLKLQGQKVGGLLLWHCREAPETIEDAFPVPVFMLDDKNKVIDMHWVDFASKEFIGTPFATYFPSGKIRWGSINLFSYEGRGVFFLVLRHQVSGGQHRVYLLAPDCYEDEAKNIDIEFDALLVPMLKLDQEGRILKFNAHAERLFEEPLAKGLVLGDLLEGLGRPMSDWLANGLKGRGLNHPNFLRARGSSREKYVQISLNRSFENGQPVLIAVLSDATELKTHEAQFVQSQKMQAIGQLAGGVAHDFNNLLTAISGHCDLLLSRHEPSDEDYGDLIQINQNADRAASLVSQLLAFSRKQTLQLESLDIRDVLSDLSHLLNRLVGERVILKVDHASERLYVRADRRQLEQVFMNLVVNARDAMPEGGKITIQTCKQFVENSYERDEATVEEGQYVSISVQDEGVEISPDKLSKILNPFSQQKSLVKAQD